MTDQPKPTLQRHYYGVQRLRKDLKTAIGMQMHHGLGDVALRVYDMHQQRVQQATNDPFVVALAIESIDIPEKERAKIALVNLLAGQLYAYLEDVVEGVSRQSRKNAHFEHLKHLEVHMPSPPPEFEDVFPQ